MSYQTKPFRFHNLVRLSLFLYILPSFINANRDVFDGELQDIEFRFAIDAGKKYCFYQVAKSDHTLEISFHVINSKLNWYPLHDNSDLRINFELFDPYNRLILKKENANSNTHVHVVKTDGVYALCFDNSFSRMASKIINLELYLYSDQDDDRWGDVDPNIKFEQESKKYIDSVEVLKASMNKIRDNLLLVTHSQDARTAIESRDYKTMRALSRFINWFTIISLIMILLVQFSQVFVIRGLFEHKSSINQLLFFRIPYFSFGFK